MNVAEINRIEAEAAADEMPGLVEGQPGAGAVPAMLPDLAEEFADFLDMAAKVAGVGLAVPTIPQRFNHGANLEISRAAIKLCEKYEIDARPLLIGQDSTLGAWLGLALALGMPGYACYLDIKAAKAQPVEGGEGGGDKQSSE